MLIEEIMHRHVRTVEPETTLKQALHLLEEHRIRHLPVTEGDRLVGIVTDRDLREAGPSILEHSPQDDTLHRPVSSIMKREVITAHPLDFIEDAARLMYEHRIGCLPVLLEGRLVGIVTQTDVLHTLIELFGVNKPSQRVEIEVPDRVGMLADAAQVFRRHKANILSVIVHPGSENTRRIAFRTEAMLIDEIVRDLRAAGHRILWPPVEDQEPEGSK
ncbi:CBS and ACT domain-containing protein [Planifilum fimeticola]